VVALDVLFEVSRQSCCAQARAILYSDAIVQEERHVSHNNGLHRSCAFHNNIEPKRAGVLQLVESQFHLASGTETRPVHRA
jgi:hypothetical protein